MLDNTAVAKSGPSKLTQTQREDQERLHRLVKNAPEGVQAKVAEDLSVSPAAVNHVVSGHRPINLFVAVAFAQRLGVTLDAISPSLTEQALKIAAVLPGRRHFAPPPAPWPFPFSSSDWDVVPDNVRRPIIEAAGAAVKESKASAVRGRRRAMKS